MRTLKTALFIFSALILFSCDSASNEYFLESPVAVSVLNNVKCVNGSVSYIGFVVDNTEKYGARIMKISGCGLQVDKGFKDGLDDKTGIYVGGAGVAVDHLVVDSTVVIATLSSGKTDYEHHKNDSEDDEKLGDHNGRVVLRSLKDNFEHDDALNESILLDFHPALIEAAQNGFYVYGTYFGKDHLGYVSLDGTLKTREIDFKVKDMTFSNGKALLFNGVDSILTVDEELNLEDVWSGDIDPDSTSGISALSKGRTAIFINTTLIVLNHNFQKLEEVELPKDYNVTSVSSTKYSSEFLYRSFPKEMMTEKVVVYEKTVEDADLLSDEDIELIDEDNEMPDVDAAIIADPLNDIDTEASDSEIDDQDVVDQAEVFDAMEGDIIWIATSTGSVLAYDIKNSSWMVTHYTDDLAEDTAENYLEMRPYLDSTFVSYPEHGATGLDNAPFIKKISVARGLSQTYTYNLTYEGIVEGSRGTTGIFDSDSMTVTDEKAKFENMNYDTAVDRVILLDKKSEKDCLIPLNTNITMDLVSIESQTSIKVAVEEYADSITSCYGESLSYGIYPEEKYSVSREDIDGRYFSGRGDELSVTAADDAISYSDEFVDISIQRMTDEVVTSKETNYYIKVSPGVPYVGLSSSDMIVKMVETIPGRLLMFSPLTRRFVEYDVEERVVVEVYK